MSLVNRRVIYPSISQLPELFFNKGSIGVLKNINSENLLILVSKSVSKTEAYEKLKEKTLKGKTIKEEIVIDAKQETILEISNKYSSWPPDAVLAIGGGVVLDSAKLIRHFLSFPEDTFDNLIKQFISPIASVKLISVPTTPNTGSESNIIAVSIDNEGKKIPLINKSFLPNLAVLDPNLLQTISPELMFDFSSDIITHAYEGSISRLSNSFLQQMAYDAIQELEKGLQNFRINNQDIESLELIHFAGHQAGVVAGNAFVGVIHALGHSLETMAKLSHGRALHTIFEQCLEWQKNKIPDKVSIIDFYLEMWKKLDLGTTANKKILKSIDSKIWADLALNDPSIKTDPFKFTSDSISEVIAWIQTNY